MPAIDHRKLQSRKVSKRSWRKLLLVSAAGLVALLVLANVGLWLVYQRRVLPNTFVGQLNIGNVAFSDLSQKISDSRLLPERVNLTLNGKTVAASIDDWGIYVSTEATANDLKQQSSSWLPLLDIFRPRVLAAQLSVNDAMFTHKAQNLESVFFKAAEPERVRFADGKFAILGAEPGHSFASEAFGPLFLQAVATGQQTLEVPVAITDPPPATADVNSVLQTVQAQVAVNLSLAVGGQAITPTLADKAKWFSSNESSLDLSIEQIAKQLSSLARANNLEPANSTDVARGVKYAIDNNLQTSLRLASSQARLHDYCVNVRGVGQEQLVDLAGKLAATLADTRGWNNGGTLAFRQVADGCDFTFWLSSPQQMTSFGGLCDDFYNCRSGNNVVANLDRWNKATDPWNVAGGSIQDYRALIINHETGHWLGFGHPKCPGAGQPAPVMMQQSIDLGGCTFNAWPRPDELSQL